MQAYFEPEQAFFISMAPPVFEILIAYKKKTCILIQTASLVKPFFFFYFVCETELVGTKLLPWKNVFFHESFVHLIYKIKHEEEFLKGTFDFSRSFAFLLHNLLFVDIWLKHLDLVIYA